MSGPQASTTFISSAAQQSVWYVVFRLRSFLSDVERGKKIPSLITLDKIAVALKSSLHRLIPNIDPSVERIGREEFLDSLRPHLKQSYAPTEASYLLVCMRSLSENFPQSDC